MNQSAFHLRRALDRRNYAKVRRIVRYTGSSVVDAPYIGLSPLHWALEHDRIAAVQVLLELGADVHRVCTRGMAAVFYVRSPAALHLLVPHSPDLNTVQG